MIYLSGGLKRVAAIHDLSGFGRCSLTAAMPVLSVMGLQCCPLPTAVLSNHTGYEDFTYLDLTGQMPGFIDRWQQLGLEFDTIYSGFLGGEDQIDIVIDFIKRFKRPGTLVAVDPVMGDNGVKYPTFSDDMCARMKRLVKSADIVFPNMTEALLLTDRDTGINKLCEKDIDAIAREISAGGPQKIIITGVVNDGRVTNYVYDFINDKRFEASARYNHQFYSGTGDIFASVVCGCLTRGGALETAAETAARFIEKAVAFTCGVGTDTREGIIFEPFLKELW
jgi:pyridoxine kinase